MHLFIICNMTGHLYFSSLSIFSLCSSVYLKVSGVFNYLGTRSVLLFYDVFTPRVTAAT